MKKKYFYEEKFHSFKNLFGMVALFTGITPVNSGGTMYNLGIYIYIYMILESYMYDSCISSGISMKQARQAF